MLSEVHDPQPLIHRWAGRSLPRRVMAHWLNQGAAPADPQPRWFTDNPHGPQIVMRLHGSVCTVHGPAKAVAAALADLRELRMEAATPWPDAAVYKEWDAAGRRELLLHRVPASTLGLARAAEFSNPPEAPQPNYRANAWYVTGAPRFAGHVKHPCRVVQGEELFPLFLEENVRDEAEYIRACLRSGPSIVCEAGGRPVSWSLTHLGGAIGRIYTPPQHRGKGYGKSLTALHVDTLLGMRGIAVASVRVDNAASYRMFQALVAKHIRGPLTWSTLLWPG